MIKHYFTKQFIVFLAVGGLAALLNWLSRLALSIWMPFSYAVVVAYVIGMLVAFLLNRLFVFPKSGKSIHVQARDFVFVNVSFFPLVWFVSLQINSWLKIFGMVNYSEELSHAIAISLPMFATFLIYKFFTFKGKQQ